MADPLRSPHPSSARKARGTPPARRDPPGRRRRRKPSAHRSGGRSWPSRQSSHGSADQNVTGAGGWSRTTGDSAKDPARDADVATGELPQELEAFLRDRGLAWRAVQEITAQSWATTKGSFRLHLHDGRCVKARLLLAGRSAERIAAWLAAGAASRRCARVLAASGRCLLEEWIDGEPLVPSGTGPSLLQECGRALAEIHRTPVPVGAVNPIAAAKPLDHLRTSLAVLVDGEFLSAREAEDLVAEAEASVPADRAQGLVHLDYCGSNLVLHRERGPICIDNETVGTGPLGLDLARTVTRWSLRGESRRQFLAGYLAAGGPAGLEHLDGWCLIAEAWSASLRARHGNPSLAAQLAALRRRIPPNDQLRSPDHPR